MRSRRTRSGRLSLSGDGGRAFWSSSPVKARWRSAVRAGGPVGFDWAFDHAGVQIALHLRADLAISSPSDQRRCHRQAGADHSIKIILLGAGFWQVSHGNSLDGLGVRRRRIAESAIDSAFVFRGGVHLYGP